ncbi:hypothetical protein BG842_18160 [Haladaptatus sp. W1]|uniref:helix-turn-helix transcriptional regulator n=1 Tax=Haladaptatus sp. W1 TaxID=1897478 RepID=UPI00084982BC|nr:helix-turn-helix transcriptional regulator [Haladaptatus sp. W1]ODR82237.1 hypothetical protein BG842_18160 [Haladaptatus sp. W1]
MIKDHHQQISEHQPDGEEATLDRVFDVLCHPHRRHILMTLTKSSPQRKVVFTLDELSDDTSGLDALQLHHIHLPKLEDVDLIRWDRNKQIVMKGSAFNSIKPYLEPLTNHPDD